MKPALTILILSLFLVACHRRGNSESLNDSELHQKIIGTWMFEKTVEEGQEPIVTNESKVVIASDGTYESRFKAVNAGLTNAYEYAGNWHIMKGDLIMDLTNASNPKGEQPGSSDRFKIIHVNDVELVYQVDMAQTIHLKRVK